MSGKPLRIGPGQRVAEGGKECEVREPGLNGLDDLASAAARLGRILAPAAGVRVALMPEATFFWLLDTSIPFNRFILTQLNERLGQFMATFEHDRLLDSLRSEPRFADLMEQCHAEWESQRR